MTYTTEENLEANPPDPAIMTFKEIRIDTCANMRSAMARQQYIGYCDMFLLKNELQPFSDKIFRCIGGTGKGMGESRIQITFSVLRIIIYVKFVVLEYYVPSLLCMKYMLYKNLDFKL